MNRNCAFAAATVLCILVSQAWPQAQLKDLPVEVITSGVKSIAYTKGPSAWDELFQTPARSNTNCSGNSSSTGQFGHVTLDCSTTSSPSKEPKETTDYREVNYYVLKSERLLFLFSCDEFTQPTWNKCPILVSGAKYLLTIDKSKVYLTNENGGKTIKKLKYVKSESAELLGKQAAQPSSQKSAAAGQGDGTSETTELSITSNPDGADISVDGQFVGNTPSTIKVTPGSHKISITLAGYKSWERTIQTSGGNVSLRATLSQQK